MSPLDLTGLGMAARLERVAEHEWEIGEDWPAVIDAILQDIERQGFQIVRIAMPGTLKQEN